MTATFIDFLFEPPWIYFIMVGAIIGGTWYLLKKYGLLPSRTPIFKGETLEQIILDRNLKKILKTFGEKLKNGKLTFSTKTIKIKRAARFPVIYEVREEKEVAKGKKKVEFIKKELDFWVFKSGGGIFENIPFLKYLNTTPEYFVVDSDERFLKKDPSGNVWSLNPGLFPHMFAGVWVVSQSGAGFLTELAYKRIQENDKEESVNALKRWIYYNDIQAGSMTTMERRQELKDESFDKMRQGAE